MAWEENSRICINMQLIAILSRTGVENESMVTFLTLTRQFFLHTTPRDVINSWGISKMSETQIIKNINGEDFTMAALDYQ